MLHNHPHIKLLTLCSIRATHAAAVHVTATVSGQREVGRGMKVRPAFLCDLASNTCDDRTVFPSPVLVLGFNLLMTY